MNRLHFKCSRCLAVSVSLSPARDLAIRQRVVMIFVSRSRCVCVCVRRIEEDALAYRRIERSLNNYTITRTGRSSDDVRRSPFEENEMIMHNKKKEEDAAKLFCVMYSVMQTRLWDK